MGELESDTATPLAVVIEVPEKRPRRNGAGATAAHVHTRRGLEIRHRRRGRPEQRRRGEAVDRRHITASAASARGLLVVPLAGGRYTPSSSLPPLCKHPGRHLAPHDLVALFEGSGLSVLHPEEVNFLGVSLKRPEQGRLRDPLQLLDGQVRRATN